MCVMCDYASGIIFSPGGDIYRDNLVMVQHSREVNVPGYLIMAPVRHIISYSQFSDEELIRFGLVMRDCIAAVEELPGVERVYSGSFAELTPHFHLHLFPRYDWMPVEAGYDEGKINGPRLFAELRQKFALDVIENRTIIDMATFLRTRITGRKAKRC